MKRYRCFFVLAVAAALSACHGGGSSPVPVGPSVVAPQKGSASIVLTIPKPAVTSGVRRAYLSPSTASITMVFTPTGSTGGGTQTFTASLTPSSTGCVSSLASTVCTIQVALSSGTYLGSFTTYDGSNNVLSEGVNIAVTILAGQANTINATLGALPARYSIAPYPGSLAAVKLTTVEPIGLSSQFIINALDASGNVIVGTGSPTYTVALSGHSSPNPMSVTQPTTTAPNTFSVSASSFDGIQQTLTVTATLEGAPQTDCTTPYSCTATFTLAPQEIIAMDSYSPMGTIEFRAYPDVSTALPSLAASSTSQGLTTDLNGNLYFFDAANKLAKSAPPYTSSTELPLGYTDANNTRIVFEPSTGIFEVNDPSKLVEIAPPYTSSFQPYSAVSNISYGTNPQRNAVFVADGGGGLAGGTFGTFTGNGNNSFDAIYCSAGFGPSSNKDAILMTYNGAGNPSIGIEWYDPSSGTGNVVPFHNTTIAAEAYQIACDPNGNTVIFYNNALNRFVPGGTAPATSISATLPYSKPYGLTMDAAGNAFYAQTNGLISWDGTATGFNVTALPFTPGNIAVVP